MLKPILLTIGIFLAYSSANAQLSNGLVAHWRMNGDATDASGKGHNGIISNVVPASGRYGVPNTAMEFAGDTGSYIIVPSQNDLNITSYSICAIVKPTQFYTDPCQVNQLFMRGASGTTDHYSLFFTDNAADSSCTVTGDTTRYTFYAGANTSDVNGGVAFGVYNKPWQYTPAITTGNWYTVVATFSGNTFKLYVDGVLKVTSVAASNIPIPAGTQDIAIGNNVWSKLQYPYSFKGVIDDMRLYDRVLADTEVTKYHNEVDTPLSVATVSVIGDIALFPNPGTGAITLQGNIDANELTIELVNPIGQIVYKQREATKSRFLNKHINLDGNLVNGLYLVRLTTDNESRVLKYTLQR
jgi:hypothetical protein